MIIEDEEMARVSLQRLCSKSQLVDVAHICKDATSAIPIMRKEEIDLVFLDIEMPEINGLQFLEKIPYLPRVIFTTSKTEYAFEAFEYNATDFLKKPITYPRLKQAIEKAVEEQKAIDAFKAESKDIFIKKDGKLVRLSLNEIEYFENAGDYVLIKTKTAKHIIYSTLKSVEKKVKDARFFKVHRSFIVNLGMIKDIEENNMLIGKKVIPISRANKPLLLNRINII